MKAEDVAFSIPAEHLAELGDLARMVSGDRRLRLRPGPSGTAWFFCAGHHLIQAPADDLAHLPADHCRGLVLHEAAHARLTMLEWILDADEMERWGTLLNIFEDMRIETWLDRTLPGGTAWIAQVNGPIMEVIRKRPWPRSMQRSFIRACYEHWWFGAAADCPPATARMMEETALCRQTIIAAIPEGMSPDQHLIRSLQARMWDAFRLGILPVWERCLDLDAAQGIAAIQQEPPPIRRPVWSRRGMPKTDQDSAPPESSPGPRDPENGIADDVLFDDFGQAPPLGPDIPSTDAWADAWGRVKPLAERLGAELLRALNRQRQPRRSHGHRHGHGIHLKSVMQAEADPRDADRIWWRHQRIRQPDPAIVLLIDISGSMRGDKIHAAFDGLVLLTETCTRIGIPIAVWSFSRKTCAEIPRSQPLDDAVRSGMGRLCEPRGDRTELAKALRIVGTEMRGWQERDRLLIVISDGIPDNKDAAARQIAQLQESGIHLVGLGLGGKTSGMAEMFPHALINVPVEVAAQRLGGLVEQAVSGHRPV